MQRKKNLFREMMDQFVTDLTELWIEVGLELKPRIPFSKGSKAESDTYTGGNLGNFSYCPEGGETCQYCQKPVLFEALEAREKSRSNLNIFKKDIILREAIGCKKPNCPQMISASA